METTSSMVRHLEKAEIDFCITSVPIEGTDLVWEPLITEEIFLLVPPNHRLAERKKIKLYEVKDEPFISMNTGYGFRNLTDEFCREAGFEPNIAFEGDEPGVIGELVRQGLGIAFIPAISWMHHSNPLLHRLQIDRPKCQRTIGLGWSKRRHLSEVALQFREFILEYFSQLSKE
jgi:DNA-binding transcriptional LysR family regulator